MPPDRGLSDKQHSGVKGKKTRLTHLFTTNVDGLRKLVPLIMGKAWKPHAFKNKTGSQLGFNYQNNTKPWMMATLYQEWLSDWDAKPNNQAIIRCFKAHYHMKFIQHAIDHYESGTTPLEIYDINQLEAMHLADKAWNKVDTTTIRNCWHKAGILPDFDSPPIQPSLPILSLVHTASNSPLPQDPIAQVETLVQNTLDDLESTGALQHSNRMDITELLNPAAEAHNVFGATNEDIYQAVMDAKKVWESAVWGASDDVDNDTPVEPAPTCGEALQAVLLLRKYTEDLNDPFAHKLEMMLGSFGQMTRMKEMQGMKDSKLTSYYPRKAH
ncbi:hypothetical protein PAXRUDRAFT_15820 [Paxillus rubicundulus Ve08.2h10]|uniref:DDE-1 domain-containing protein n=1 Tax=Paxillus rubicundulus Ve08.2h10 TaxID=930991 RepID=A0A0D0DGL2_9AGAM|nr:hypothetical protein PAXRUDRAFT_15820 [Paxillus rubicundulus Ve08.2h10]